MSLTFRGMVATVLVPAVLSAGCLSSSYHVSQDELMRLAQTPPDQRWQSVRATQHLMASDRPPVPSVVVPATAVTHVPDSYLFQGRSYIVPEAWRCSNQRTGRTGATTRADVGSSSGGRSSEHIDAAVRVVVVVAAAVLVFVLAGSEGARYDGWLGVAPDEMLYLDNVDGSITAVPLSGLTPQLVAQSHHATLYEGPHDRYLHLLRAPFNRRGFALQSGFNLGIAPAMAGTRDRTGYTIGGRAFFGGFPMHQVGVGATADVLSSSAGNLVAGMGGEVQLMPIDYAGAYLGAGWMTVTNNDSDLSLGAWYVRAGAQFELPITTRFAANLRAGVTRIDLGASHGASYVPEASLGLSVY